ncbi:MAG: endonuclease MutS2, partial [Bacilli bacterium]|nr:endonuclease MutS2 [Bacilli bacterium]
ILKLSGSVQDLSRGLIAKYAEFLSEKAITIRNDHFVLPVQTSYKNKVPGMIHDISDTGATTFVEPQELVLLSNQIYALRVEEKEEIYRLLKVLTEKVAFHE